jgi:hypothetical protein
MKPFLFISAIFFVLTGFYSCALEEYDETNTETEEITPDTVFVNHMMAKAFSKSGSTGLTIECYILAYPFSVKNVKDSIVLISDEDDLQFEVTQNGMGFIDFVYPLTLTDKLGEIRTVYNVQEFATLAGACFPSVQTSPGLYFPAYAINRENSCYSLVYPIHVLDESGMDFPVDHETDLVYLLAEKPYFFHFPLTLRHESGLEMLILDAEMLFQTLMSCNGSYHTDSLFVNVNQFQVIGCYEHVFPFQVRLVNRALPFTVENENILAEIYLQNKFESFVFPLKLKDFSGTEFTINSEGELNQKIGDCFIDGSFFLLVLGTPLFEPACYNLNFPVRATTPFGNQKTYQNYQQIQAELADSLFYQSNVVFPVEVTRISTSETLTFNNVFDILNLLSDCQ